MNTKKIIGYCYICELKGKKVKAVILCHVNIDGKNVLKPLCTKCFKSAYNKSKNKKRYKLIKHEN